MISAAALPCDGRPHQTNRPRRSRDLLAPPAGCRFAPTPGSSCSSGQCEPRPETIPRLAHRALALPGLAVIAIQELRKLCLRRRIGPRTVPDFSTSSECARPAVGHRCGDLRPQLKRGRDGLPPEINPTTIAFAPISG